MKGEYPVGEDITDQVREALQNILAQGSGRVGVAAQDLRTGREITWRADESFPTASMIKMAVLVELERQVLAGEQSWEASLRLTPEVKVGGSSLLRRMSDGLLLPVYDLAYLMMTVSDNTATNMLIDLVGLDRVNRTMTDHGLSAIRLNNKIDFSRLWTDPNDFGVGAPRAFCRLMADILEARILTPEACRHMLKFMDGVGAGERLARYLPYNPYAAQQRERGASPQETGPILHFAGKTGGLTGVRTHTAALWSEEVPLRLAFSVMIADSTDRTWSVDMDALLTIARIGKLVYDTFT